MKRTLLLSLVVVLILSACKKKNEEVIISLQGKWTAESDVYKEYNNSTLTSTYTYTYEKTTFDFQSNNNLLIKDEYGTETLPYTIQNGTTVTFAGDTYEIKNLTAKSVVLYYREEYAPGEYMEYFINLKK
ncbi:hypothetical protein [Lacibacter sediminis]|uniref:Lipocalin-like domain-containing protein n=1 Tax=Lacibacter sediminis TaxID=2760713 RepID=A0A7G5XHW4_9BACT|nr:hypothetical protein [Lacibacter sediminis]QNA45067.1 hypothetical protein H4075_02395 [Lacibacter sediminis]